MMRCRPIYTSMDPNAKLQPQLGEPPSDLGRCSQLIGMLIYLKVPAHDISFPVGVVSQFMDSPGDCHWDAIFNGF